MTSLLAATDFFLGLAYIEMKSVWLPYRPHKATPMLRSFLIITIVAAAIIGCTVATKKSDDASAMASFHCADHIKATRTDTIVQYLGTDEQGFCRLRYGKGSVRHLDLIYDIASLNQPEYHEAYVGLILHDPPGGQRTLYSRDNRGGTSITYTVIDRDDYNLNGEKDPCVHYTVRTRYGSGSGAQDFTTHLWVNSANGVVFNTSRLCQ
jgi:hypothetical protein